MFTRNFDISFSATVFITDMLFKLVSTEEEPGTFILTGICGQRAFSRS
ncbi:uncharacterized protein PADG_08352 [Paracoccidioides brasiliensis Pb18]|uniref:Uncharacterized protein n=1 Tax=Paracoccidioides brasiliensis (strain Pb18) TaxID=502780 RepID=C1GLW1_PARBD|nr:uncharacterized protein PADG_08352 [Paracoccidioides brasiliensis Pb18]EEH43427.2 hypothetical protein PADG_08352 [Paracoccidioides brasiliensis Pb18]